MRLFVILPVFCISLVNCQSKPQQKQRGAHTAPAKFEPAEGRVILFVGQELEAIGGTTDYNDGYFNHFPAAGGFTQYTSFQRGPNGLNGLEKLADWGDGPENMSVTVKAVDLYNSCLAIGLDISNGNDSLTATGIHDSLILHLGSWIKSLGGRPVFLRIGYEFDGFDWNHYKKEHYIPAFRRIRRMLDSIEVTNVAYVWQSKGEHAKREVLDEFYPGDDFVDWVGYSYFIPADSSHPMIGFARDHHKPLFIAESSTVFLDSAGVSEPLDLSKQEDAERAWRDWFGPYFRTIHANADVIKAIHYINSPWKTRPLWKNNNYFKNIDARITRNEWLKKKWLNETNQPRYLLASDTLFRYLYGAGK